MDPHRIDAISRLLAQSGSRRGVLGTLLASLGLGVAAPISAKTGHRSRHKRAKAQAQAGLRNCPFPKPGQNLSKCDFQDLPLSGFILRGANLSGASFRGADLCGADLRGSNLAKVDFTNANLTRVDLRGTNLATAKLTGAMLCQTRMPNGKLDNTDCPADANVCCRAAECQGNESCHQGACREVLAGTCTGVDHVCTLSKPCCPGSDCSVTPLWLLTTCQTGCDNDQQCFDKLGTHDVTCVNDLTACFGKPNGPDYKCCRPRTCVEEDQCPTNHTCCVSDPTSGVCCIGSQTCSLFGFGCIDN